MLTSLFEKSLFLLCDISLQDLICALLQNFRGGFGAKESYKKLEALGEGSYATVYKGISR